MLTIESLRHLFLVPPHIRGSSFKLYDQHTTHNTYVFSYLNCLELGVDTIEEQA